MPRGGPRIGAGRPRKPREPTGPSSAIDDPIEFLLSVMRDPLETLARRDRAARALLPSLHTRAADVGKKERAAKAANTAGMGHWGALLQVRPAPPRKQ